jgi:hypothetical protein
LKHMSLGRNSFHQVFEINDNNFLVKKNPESGFFERRPYYLIGIHIGIYKGRKWAVLVLNRDDGNFFLIFIFNSD